MQRNRACGSGGYRARVGKCPWSCQVDATFPLLCLTLVRTIAVWLDPTAVSPAPPFSQVFAFDRSQRRERAMAPRRRVPWSGEAVPWGFSAADAWKMVSRYTWGSCDRATRGHFCLSPPAGSFAYAFADRRLLCSKDWCSQPRFGAVLDGGFAVARQIRCRPVHNLIRVDNLQRVVETSASESAVLDRARALSINATVAAMPSVVVELTYDRKGSAKAWCGSLAAGSAFIAKASLAAGA